MFKILNHSMKACGNKEFAPNSVRMKVFPILTAGKVKETC